MKKNHERRTRKSGRRGRNKGICCNYISEIKIDRRRRRDSNKEEKEKEIKDTQEKGRCGKEEKKY
jgi:hypothetical protein